MMPLVHADNELLVNGVIEHIDIPGRELRVRTQGMGMDLDVPVSCAILLNDERVKLRLLQDGDFVHIRYSMVGSTASASFIQASGTKAVLTQYTAVAHTSGQAG